MAKPWTRILGIAFLLTVPLLAFAAETTKLRFISAIYLDEKGGGMSQPEAVACNGRSTLIVADTANGRLLRYTVRARDVTPVGEIRLPQLSYPIRVEMNSKGEIFVLNGKQLRIVRLSPDGQFKGYLTPEGLPGSTRVVPRSLKIDQHDNLYLLDILGGRVLILTPDGKYERHMEFPKEFGFFSDLAVDRKGSVYLVDSVKGMVFSASKEATQFSPLTKSLKEYLSFPTSITTDERGVIFLVDQNGDGIVIIGQDGSFLGRQLSMGWTPGLLYYPSQMCITDKREFFIADRGNNRVQFFALVQ
jgi:hypothetical protein